MFQSEMFFLRMISKGEKKNNVYIFFNEYPMTFHLQCNFSYKGEKLSITI